MTREFQLYCRFAGLKLHKQLHYLVEFIDDTWTTSALTNTYGFKETNGALMEHFVIKKRIQSKSIRWYE